MQQSWAYGYGVNLLSAGASTLENTGSGIYSGRLGALRAIMADTPTTKVLVAELPKRPSENIHPGAHNEDVIETTLKATQNLWKENLDQYQIYALDFEKNYTQVGKQCHGTICCEYNITVNISAPDAKPEVDIIYFVSQNTNPNIQIFTYLFHRTTTPMYLLSSMVVAHLVMTGT